MRDYREKVYPSDTLEICEENIEMFFRFMYERHMIWHRRFVDRLSRDQWTNDPILKVTKYTNIYRELDRGTLWYLKNIADVYAREYDGLNVLDPIRNRYDDLLKDLIWKTVIYRLCNRIETFEEVGFPNWRNYNRSGFSELDNEYCAKLVKISERGQPVMTSAHLTCPSPPGYTKVEGFILAVNDLHAHLDYLVRELRKSKTSKEVFQNLMVVHCVGNFIAYECLCDLIYCQAIGNDNKPFTLNDWANVGPGAKEGIRMLFPSTKGKNNIYDKMVELWKNQEIYWEKYGLKIPYYERFTKGRLSLRSLEHGLCEFQKYFLQRLNLGKQRMILKPNDNRSIEKEENGKMIKYQIIVTPDGTSVERKYL